MRVCVLALVLGCGCPAGDSAPAQQRPSSSERPRADGGVPASSAARLDAEVKLITEFVADDARPTEGDVAVVEAVRKLGEAHREEPLPAAASAALLALLRRLKAHTPKAKHRGMYRVLNATMVAVADPKWEPDLIAMIEAPIASAQHAHRKALLDQVFWQITAAEVLGVLRSKEALRPLVKVTLSPFKSNVALTAMDALARIGKPAIPVVVSLLEGSDPQLVRYAEAERRRAVDDGRVTTPQTDEALRRSHLATAVAILGHLGTQDASAPLLSAARSESKWLRQHAAAQLYRLPQEPAAIDAFKRVYAEAELGDALIDGANAKQTLGASAPLFFDAMLLEWLVADTKKLKGSAEAIQAVKRLVFDHGLMAATTQTWPAIEALWPQVKSTLEGGDLQRFENARAGAKRLLDACQEDARCYAEELEKVGPERMPALRAAHMLVLVGADRAAEVVLQHALSTENNSVREVLATALLRLRPQGDLGAARAIEAAYRSASVSGDEPRMAALKPLRRAEMVLRARALP